MDEVTKVRIERLEKILITHDDRMLAFETQMKEHSAQMQDLAQLQRYLIEKSIQSDARFEAAQKQIADLLTVAIGADSHLDEIDAQQRHTSSRLDALINIVEKRLPPMPQ